MKTKSVVVIFLCMIICFIACAGKQVEGPGIEFKKEIYNFGQVNEGEKVKYSFVFKNIGNEEVVIVNVQPTCGCTVAGEYDHLVAPGESGNIPVELKTNGYEGEITKLIRVKTNVPGKEDITLTLQGKVSTPISISPKYLWLGQVTANTAMLTGTVTLKNNTKTPLKIVEIMPHEEKLNIKIDPVKKNQEYQIDVTINPPFGKGRVNGDFSIKTNIKEKEIIKIIYSYVIKTDIIIYPPVIIIDPEKMENPSEQVITIESSLPDPISITNPQVIGSDLKFKIDEITPNKIFQIKISFPAGFKLGGKEMLVFSFQVESSERKNVYNVPIKSANTEK